MDISTECRMRHYRDDDHREDSPHFNNGSLPDFETLLILFLIRVKLGLGTVPNWRIHPIFILIIFEAYKDFRIYLQ